jgi:hypothetical protein
MEQAMACHGTMLGAIGPDGKSTRSARYFRIRCLNDYQGYHKETWGQQEYFANKNSKCFFI